MAFPDRSCQLPADGKERLDVGLLLQLSLNLSNKLSALLVDPILGLEEAAAPTIPQHFQRLDLLLACKLLFQRRGCCRRAARLLDLPVDLLDFSLQTHFQVV